MSPSVQSPTTPNQYNLLRNEDAPLLIEPKCTLSPTTPNQYNLLRNEEAPLLIDSKCTEPYYTKPV